MPKFPPRKKKTPARCLRERTQYTAAYAPLSFKLFFSTEIIFLVYYFFFKSQKQRGSFLGRKKHSFSSLNYPFRGYFQQLSASINKLKINIPPSPCGTPKEDFCTFHSLEQFGLLPLPLIPSLVICNFHTNMGIFQEISAL